MASASVAAITIFGVDSLDEGGDSVSNAGDVNGDGYDDLIIGAARAAGLNNSVTEAGESYLIFGGPSLASTIDLANLGSAGVTIFGLDLNDGSGSSVSSAGDLNRDGYGDLIIGAPGADGVDNLRENSGETNVIYGSPSLPSTIHLGSLGSAGVTIYGADVFDGSGNSAAVAGDVNGDGFDDLIIGAYHGGGRG